MGGGKGGGFQRISLARNRGGSARGGTRRPHAAGGAGSAAGGRLRPFGLLFPVPEGLCHESVTLPCWIRGRSRDRPGRQGLAREAGYAVSGQGGRGAAGAGVTAALRGCGLQRAQNLCGCQERGAAEP